MSRWLRRLVPWALTLGLGLLGLQVWGSGLRVVSGQNSEPSIYDRQSETPNLPQTPEDCARMLVLSDCAASLTGSLAMLDAEERPVLAQSVSDSLRRILEHEARDTELAGVVEGLADSLERYAAGDRAALAEVQVLSARNAQLRTHYELCMAQEKDRDE